MLAHKPYPMLDRGRWGWEMRHLDFELYKKPPPFLELPPAAAREPLTGKALPGGRQRPLDLGVSVQAPQAAPAGSEGSQLQQGLELRGGPQPQAGCQM